MNVTGRGLFCEAVDQVASATMTGSMFNGPT